MLKFAVSFFIIGCTSAFALDLGKKPPSFMKALDNENLPEAISAKGVKHQPKVREAQMYPRGSAVLTRSGDLSKSGIKHIIHAAPGAMASDGPEFSPSLEGLKLSVKNSLYLAKKMGLKCVAMPFIGSGIFQTALGVTKEKLASEILVAALDANTKVRVVFVPFGDEDTAIFSSLMKSVPNRGLRDLIKFKRDLPPHFVLAPGSILDFPTHKCDTIVNAANMELQFGGGLSGRIASATGQAEAINAVARDFLVKYYSGTSKPSK